jgi:membrane protease YdiL (CAAX protease family)
MIPNDTPYLALAILPVVVSIPLDPVSFMWGWKHRFTPMPPEVAERSRKLRRYVMFMDDALIVALVLILSRTARITPPQMGLNLISWKRNLLLGCASGILWAALQWVVKRLFFSSSRMTPRFFQGGSASLWILVFISGAFSEELWRSFCVVALKGTGHTTAFVVLVTAAVFAIAHIWGGLARASGRFPFGLAAALVFVWTGSLLTTYSFHLISNLATIGWIRRDATKIA